MTTPAPAVITPKAAKAVSVEKMSPALAVQYFAHAILALDFMERGAQNQVNTDYDKEMPSRQAGNDVDGREIAGSLKTRSNWTKLRRGLEKAHKLASDTAALAK